jgi:hypothetical protein
MPVDLSILILTYIRRMTAVQANVVKNPVIARILCPWFSKDTGSKLKGVVACRGKYISSKINILEDLSSNLLSRSEALLVASLISADHELQDNIIDLQEISNKERDQEPRYFICKLLGIARPGFCTQTMWASSRKCPIHDYDISQSI